jgi:trans-feruloyl-CoA hydratase/vanillin synthase
MLRIEHPCPGVRLIGLDRAPKRNAIGVELTLALRDALWDLRCNTDIRSVVIHGIGGHFSAGMDLKDFFDSSSRDARTLRQARAATEEWRCHLIRELPQALFVAIEGYCLGGALPIVQCARRVAAHPDAKLGLPELNFGFVPGGQIIKSVGQAVPPKALSYLALTGKLIDAGQARRWGLVSTVTPEPLAQALAWAREAAS